MEVGTNSITITDPKIIAYQRENPSIDIIPVIHLVLDLIQNLTCNLATTVNSSVNSRILSVVSNIEKNINDKINETKKEYIEDVRLVLTNNSLTNNEKINSIVEKTADNILTKTTLLINEVVPKGNEKICSQLEGCIKLIENDTKKLLETNAKGDNQSHDLIYNIDKHFSNMVSNIQQPIFSFIQSSEERTTTGIQQIKDGASIQQHFQEKLTSELNEFLNKYKHNSTVKGSVSETELYHMLQHTMKGDEIINVSGETASCDFRVNRRDPNKPTILFENKDYNKNVSSDEVKKFERDILNQKKHGIFISQKTCIAYKTDFQIDIINGFIHLYISEANYDTTKLRTAIDIVDSLSSKLEVIANASETTEKIYPFNKEDLDELAEEYRIFTLQKSSIVETYKLMNKQMIEKLEEFQLPKIKKLLIKLGNIESDAEFKCIHCNVGGWKNKASLAAHVRSCKSKEDSK
jgi:hypothetical protein